MAVKDPDVDLLMMAAIYEQVYSYYGETNVPFDRYNGRFLDTLMMAHKAASKAVDASHGKELQFACLAMLCLVAFSFFFAKALSQVFHSKGKKDY